MSGFVQGGVSRWLFAGPRPGLARLPAWFAAVALVVLVGHSGSAVVEASPWQTPADSSPTVASAKVPSAEGQAADDSIRIVKGEDGSVEILGAGGLMTRFVNPEGKTPYFYPLLAPGQIPMTRGFPVDPRPGEPEDHPHHRSLWVAHGETNGIDFWTGKGITRTRLLEPGEPDAGPGIPRDGEEAGPRLRYESTWMSDSSEAVGKLLASWQFRESGATRVIDAHLVLQAIDRPLVLGDTKEGFFAVRLHPGLQLTRSPGLSEPTGAVVNSEGQRGAAVWARRARWVSYSGLVDGRQVSLAILDHPRNLRHPTTWHARDYGLFTANPFGLHDFEKWPKGTGEWKIEPGQSLELRYRLLISAGPVEPHLQMLEEEFRAFSQTPGER